MRIKLAETENELIRILDLQEENHFKNVSSEIQNSEGFVTVEHDLKTLSEMNKMARQVIAVDHGTVVGYALVMPRECKEMIPVLMPMFETFESLHYKQRKMNDLDYYVMGQVCIKKSHRGKGIFRLLYEKHKECYSDIYEVCLTEVSTKNYRSMKAHESIGFNIIHTFRDQTDEWSILAWDWS